MSTHIVGYTEAKVGDKWHCIDFYQYDRGRKLRIVPSIEGGSVYADALEWECRMVRIDPPTDLSDLVRAECTTRDGRLYGEGEPYWRPWHMVDGSWFIEVDLSQPEFCAFFPRQSVANYLLEPDKNEMLEEEKISVEEYRSLDAEAMKAYQYFEYTPRYGNRAIMRRFKAAVKNRIDAFNKTLELREEIGFSDVRVILIYS